jgi:hypothetical protein
VPRTLIVLVKKWGHATAFKTVAAALEQRYRLSPASDLQRGYAEVRFPSHVPVETAQVEVINFLDEAIPGWSEKVVLLDPIHRRRRGAGPDPGG